MKVTLSLFLCQILICIGCVSLDSQAQQEDKLNVNSNKQNQQKKWQPATYKGLIMGTSIYDDMLRVLGAPQDVVPSEKERKKDKKFENSPLQEVWYHYDVNGVIPGKLVVGVNHRTKRIIRIIIRPQDANLSKEEVIKHYGSDYTITRYSFDDCLGDWDSAPIFESPDGQIKRLEYREEGISVSLGDKDVVNHITYESESPGSSSSRCKNKDKKDIN